jgi:hypothetical protein
LKNNNYRQQLSANELPQGRSNLERVLHSSARGQNKLWGFNDFFGCFFDEARPFYSNYWNFVGIQTILFQLFAA